MRYTYAKCGTTTETRDEAKNDDSLFVLSSATCSIEDDVHHVPDLHDPDTTVDLRERAGH